jgi:hypothetical protein
MVNRCLGYSLLQLCFCCLFWVGVCDKGGKLFFKILYSHYRCLLSWGVGLLPFLCGGQVHALNQSGPGGHLN